VRQLENTIRNFVDCIALQFLIDDMKKLEGKFDKTSIDTNAAKALRYFIKEGKPN